MADSNCGKPVFISDLGRVLVDIDYTGFLKILKNATLLDEAEFQVRIIHQTEEQYRLFETGKLSEKDFFSQFHRQLRLDRLDESDLPDIWNDIFTPNRRMLDLISGLKEEGALELVLVSNTNPTHFAYCDSKYPELSLFDRRVLSYQVGAMKPDIEIYRAALAPCDEKRLSFYIDDIPEYIAAASHAGIWGVVFRGYEDFLEQAGKDPLFGKYILSASSGIKEERQ